MDIKSFLTRLYSQIRDAGIDPNIYNCDHICYRTSSIENYLKKKQEFSKSYRFLTETEVNGRPISTFFMTEPIAFENQRIHLIELPAPKPGKVTTEGLEHAEFVVDDLIQFQKRHEHLKFNFSGMSKAYNQELEIEFNHVAVKFHEQSLLEVIQTERLDDIQKINWRDPASMLQAHSDRDLLLNAIHNSKVLNKFNAVLAGTFPLQINIENSDLDFICEISNLEQFQKELVEAFSTYGQFKIWNNKEAICCSFVYQDIPFEIFGQNKPVFEQNAFRHMLVEAKLIALTGDWCIPYLINLKRNGLKTEPAFAQFWNLSGDPYQSLLKLSDTDISGLAFERLQSR